MSRFDLRALTAAQVQRTLVLHGEQGLGKSALLAEMSEQYNGPELLASHWCVQATIGVELHGALCSLVRSVLAAWVC